MSKYTTGQKTSLYKSSLSYHIISYPISNKHSTHPLEIPVHPNIPSQPKHPHDHRTQRPSQSPPNPTQSPHATLLRYIPRALPTKIPTPNISQSTALIQHRRIIPHITHATPKRTKIRIAIDVIETVEIFGRGIEERLGCFEGRVVECVFGEPDCGVGVGPANLSNMTS